MREDGERTPLEETDREGWGRIMKRRAREEAEEGGWGKRMREEAEEGGSGRRRNQKSRRQEAEGGG